MFVSRYIVLSGNISRRNVDVEEWRHDR